MTPSTLCNRIGVFVCAIGGVVNEPILGSVETGINPGFEEPWANEWTSLRSNAVGCGVIGMDWSDVIEVD